MQFITGSQFGFDGTGTSATTGANTVGEISCFNNPDHYYRRMWYAMQFDSMMTSSSDTSNMDTSSSSPDNTIADSRKRPLEIENDSGVTKRSHYNTNGEPESPLYHFKLLIPCVAAGAIIGKGGETIAQLQREKHAKIKMSKANDFYPGTTERVCIISSNSPESIMAVLIFVMEKIREKPEFSKPVIPELNSERDKQVKILVPNTTAGMIIGKGGSYIKQIKEQTGAYIQLSQKPKDISLPERCITVSGDLETNTKVCQMILQKIMEDTQSGSCLNLSYADVTGPVANFSPTGSPYANKPVLSNGIFAASNGAVNGSLNICLNMPSATNNLDSTVIAKIVENVNLSLHSSGFSEPATTEIIAALTILARYGMLGIGYGLQNNSSATNGTAGKATNNLVATNTVDLSTLNTANNLFGAALGNAAAALSATPRSSFDPGTAAAASAAAATLDLFHPSQLNLNPNNNCLSLLPGAGGGNDILADLSTAATEIKKVDLEVTDAILGIIVGPSGRTLLEIQFRSGSVIQISKKSLYSSVGVSNRIISISGTSASIAAAQFLIEQKVNESISKGTHRANIAIPTELN